MSLLLKALWHSYCSSCTVYRGSTSHYNIYLVVWAGSHYSCKCCIPGGRLLCWLVGSHPSSGQHQSPADWLTGGGQGWRGLRKPWEREQMREREKGGRYNRERQKRESTIEMQNIICKVTVFLKGQVFHMQHYPYPAPARIPASAAAALRSSCTGKCCTSHLARS